MRSVNIVVYTMQGCPHCVEFKRMLTEKKIEFYDRDIEEFKDEYELFVRASENNFIPALLIIEDNGDIQEPHIYTPETHYNTLDDAIVIIENHLTGNVI